MKRISLILAGAVACLLFVSVGTAMAAGAAMGPEPETPKINATCKATSNNVVGNRITATVTGTNVAKSQQRFANCGYVRKVVKGLTDIRIEKPKVVEGFRCTPTVLTSGQGTEEAQVVKYSCLFRGADTATEIRIKFKVTYNQD
jgi:hypothetical protein